MAVTARTRRRVRVLVPLAAGLGAGAVITVVLTAILHGDAPGVPDSVAEARSVILINGDGMSAAHREAARLHQVGSDGALAMGSMPATGWQTTHSADPDVVITDSAAAASAWATGEKTYNGAISVDLDGDPLPTLGVEAKESGRATGLVTTADVTDASPAAFFSNAASRDAQDDILRQYLTGSRPDVILGGGLSRWRGGNGSADFVAQAQERGYEYVTDSGELDAVHAGRLLGLFAEEQMYGSDGPDSEYESAVPLADLTAKALDVLSRDEDGFFLFVEEEGIDAASHDANGTAMLDAMRALDAAVEVARAYVADHPDTLLIVTGDHETGGLGIEDADAPDAQEESRSGPFPVAGSDRDFVLDWSGGDHTGEPTPVTAEGPGSRLFEGSYPNTYLHDVMRMILVE